MVVKNFDSDRVQKLIDSSDPYLKQYIESLKGSLERQKELTSKAIAKLKNNKEIDSICPRCKGSKIDKYFAPIEMQCPGCNGTGKLKSIS